MGAVVRSFQSVRECPKCGRWLVVSRSGWVGDVDWDGDGIGVGVGV